MEDMYDVIMTDSGLYKMTVALCLKDICTVEFAVAKQAVINLPFTVKREITASDAEEIRAILTEAGAEITVKQSLEEVPQSVQPAQPVSGDVTAMEMPMQPVKSDGDTVNQTMPSVSSAVKPDMVAATEGKPEIGKPVQNSVQVPMQNSVQAPMQNSVQTPVQNSVQTPVNPAAANQGGLPPVAMPAPKSNDVNRQKSDVVLVSYGDNKLNVIKALRDYFGLSLKTAKEITESAPCTLQKGIPYPKAVKIKKMLEKVGAKVMLK